MHEDPEVAKSIGAAGPALRAVLFAQRHDHAVMHVHLTELAAYGAALLRLLLSFKNDAAQLVHEFLNVL